VVNMGNNAEIAYKFLLHCHPPAIFANIIALAPMAGNREGLRLFSVPAAGNRV
jgi:hypothetical protein